MDTSERFAESRLDSADRCYMLGARWRETGREREWQREREKESGGGGEEERRFFKKGMDASNE